jgi:hypothetical protein
LYLALFHLTPFFLASTSQLVLLGDCDTLTLHLIQELGWLDELKRRRDLLPDHSQNEPLLQ